MFHLGTPQCSQKALYESEEVQAYWDIPVFVEYNKVRAKNARKDSRSSSEDSDNSGNELPLDPESREERRGEGVEVWSPIQDDTI